MTNPPSTGSWQVQDLRAELVQIALDLVGATTTTNAGRGEQASDGRPGAPTPPRRAIRGRPRLLWSLALRTITA